jgi:hypothetical protein
MSTLHSVVNIAEGYVQGVVVILAGSDRHCGLVTSENDWCEHCTVC